MSELKATTAYDVYWKANSVGEGTGILVYLKSEADKVIAELKDKARHYPMMALIIEESKRDLLRQAKEIRHHKYKRCLEKANWGFFWANYWHCCEPTDLGAFIARERFYRKWHKRWLKIGEKFKPNNEVNNG